MNRRIKESLERLDFKSIVLTVLFLGIGVTIYFYTFDFRDGLRESEQKKCTRRASGEIISIEKMDRISQSKWNGTRISVDGYKVSYWFEVDGRRFESVDIVPGTMKNQNWLNSILEGGSGKVCYVAFDSENPKRSLLVESSEKDQ